MARKWSEDEAAGWLNTDVQGELLDLPRRIAASIVSLNGGISKFIDIASGSGIFLKVFLDRFPESSGIWHDASETMKAAAQKSLESYSSRISWVTGDMQGIASLGLATDLDAVVTSRATHHFSADELRVFYADAATLLRPGGWIINLDHAYLGSTWDPVLRNVRKQLLAKKPENASGHKHLRPAPQISDHLSALAAAGITDAFTAWQAFYTFLIIARKPIEESSSS